MTRRIPVRFSRHASAAVLCLLLGLAYFPISGIRAASTAPSMTLRGAGQPFVSVQSARNLAVSYTGDAAAVAGMQGGARPTALTSVDLDADGAPDLIAGYATANGGVISVTRGNPDAFAPKDPGLYRQAMQGKVPPSFLSKAAAFSVPESPELLASGDFDGDGYRDVLSAARGGSLYLLTGDGHGNLASPRQVSLPGQVSALAVTGSGHLAVAIDSGSVSQLLIVDSKAGFRTLGTYDLPGSATAAAWGSLGDEPSADVAVAAGGKLVIVYDALSNDAQAETISLAFSVQSLTLGDFVWDRDGKTEIAALGNDGAVRILQRGTLDTRPLTAADIPGRRARMFAKGHAARKTPAALGTWTVAKQIDGASSSASGVSVPGMLQPSRLGRTSGRGLMVFDRSQKQVNLVDPSGTGGSAIALASEPVALQVTPPKLNGRRGLIILTA